MESNAPMRGANLEGMSKSVQAGKEDRAAPSDQAPTVINQSGGRGGGGGGGGEAPSSPSGSMGLSIPVRNEEPTLLAAQFGSVRVV
jgi:hypothetical protein